MAITFKEKLEGKSRTTYIYNFCWGMDRPLENMHTYGEELKKYNITLTEEDYKGTFIQVFLEAIEKYIEENGEI